MLSSEPLMRVLYADRMKDLERVARERRMLEPAAEPTRPTLAAVPVRAARPTGPRTAGRGSCGDSATAPV